MDELGTHLAHTLRTLRQQRGWSLDQAAATTGVSKAMLGQIERGESSPTIGTLWRIATGFATPLSAFITPLPASDTPPLVRDARTLRTHPGAEGLLVAPLFPFDAALGCEILELTLLPGFYRESEAHAPGVIEHILVLSGGMAVLVDGEWNELAAGQAIRFAADRAHGYRNRGDAPAVCHNLIHYPRSVL